MTIPFTIERGTTFTLTYAISGVPAGTRLRLETRLTAGADWTSGCFSDTDNAQHLDLELSHKLLDEMLAGSLSRGTPPVGNVPFPEGNNKLKEDNMSPLTNNDVKLSKLPADDQLLVLNNVMDVDGNPTSYGRGLTERLQFDASKEALVAAIKGVNAAKEAAKAVATTE